MSGFSSWAQLTPILLLAIVLSWGIALVEYCLAVPANRFGRNV